MIADVIVIAVTWTGMYSPVKDALKTRTRIGATSVVVLADGQPISRATRYRDVALTAMFPGSLYFM